MGIKLPNIFGNIVGGALKKVDLKEVAGQLLSGLTEDLIDDTTGNWWEKLPDAEKRREVAKARDMAGKMQNSVEWPLDELDDLIERGEKRLKEMRELRANGGKPNNKQVAADDVGKAIAAFIGEITDGTDR